MSPRSFLLVLAVYFFSIDTISAFGPISGSRLKCRIDTEVQAHQNAHSDSSRRKIFDQALTAATFSLLFPFAVRADEIGVSNDAPTLSTGEEVEICVKRGPLGKCEKTELRTPENDNDKASKYMNKMAPRIQEKDMAMRASSDGSEGSELVKKLLAQTEENREKNERIVQRKTLANDQAAILGPFDQSVFILNSDGENYTMLENAQAMRLKRRGFIKDKRFVTQPTEEEINFALEPGDDEGLDGIVNAVRGVFGNKQ